MSPLYFIRLIRKSFVGSDVVFTSGSCFRLYEILKAVFPHSKPYIQDGNHVLTKIENQFYDINGYVTPKENPVKFDKNNPSHLELKNNKFHGHIDFIQCPNCDDVFYYCENGLHVKE